MVELREEKEGGWCVLLCEFSSTLQVCDPSLLWQPAASLGWCKREGGWWVVNLHRDTIGTNSGWVEGQNQVCVSVGSDVVPCRPVGKKEGNQAACYTSSGLIYVRQLAGGPRWYGFDIKDGTRRIGKSSRSRSIGQSVSSASKAVGRRESSRTFEVVRDDQEGGIGIV